MQGKASSFMPILSLKLEEIREKIKEVPESILHVALKIYKDHLGRDPYTHPNYFINTALKIKSKSKIVKKKSESINITEPLTNIGRGI